MRVLISGAAGCIGSHLADLLLSHGHDVVGLDNLLTGRLSNVAHLKHDSRFTLLQQDVTENFKIDGPLDRIYHLASPASPVAYASHRIETMKVNSQGTWNLLDLALEKKSRFLVASTSEIYGDPPKNIQREDFWGNVNPIGNPQETTIIELAKCILDLLPESKSKITFEPRADYDPRNRCPDIMRAKQILNWTPKIPLKEGLSKVVEYHRRES